MKIKHCTVFAVLAVLITSSIGLLARAGSHVETFGSGEVIPLPGPVIRLTYEKPKTRIERMLVTAYSSSEDETDSTPTLSASGESTHQGMVANNCLPFGTKVIMEGGTYYVEDRGALRHGCQWLDLWMPSKEAALQFGRQKLLVTIYEN